MLLLFFTLFSLFLFIFCLLCIFSIHFTYKFDDIPEHLWYNLENLITYLLRYQGQKVFLPPLIPDCYVLCTLAILKNIRNPLIFL